MSSRWAVVGGWALLGLAACSAHEGPATDDAGTGSASENASAAADASATDTGTAVSADAGTGFDDGGPAFVGFDAGALATDDGDAAACGSLSALIRDFRDSHPDFEHYMGSGVTKGIVETTLGDGRKPVYANPVYNSGAQQTTGRTEFDQWYRDVDGVNQPFMIDIPVVAQAGSGLFVYDSNALQPPGFFPIDGKGFGNQGRPHNYHFTTEIHTSFMYRGGEVFTFRGDDDLWLFVNGKLALDLGGLHSPVAGTVNFDQLASTLGISTGNTYNMDIFHAERHTVESNFRIETSIDCFVPVILR